MNASKDRGIISHSVAFRVTEGQWQRLQRLAKAKGTTVPKLAKDLLFANAGLREEPPTRSSYGHSTQR